jgi:hypothetical protein
MKFIENRDFLKELREDPGVRAQLAEAAWSALVEARAMAPRDTGAYAESLYAEGNTLGSTHPAADSIEFGTIDTPPHATLRRAAAQSGARIVSRFE